MITRMTIQDVKWDAVKSVLQLGDQYQFNDDSPDLMIILDPTFRGEEAVYEYTRALIASWIKEEIEPGVFQYTRPTDNAKCIWSK